MPPVIATSARVKSLVGSLRLNVITVVSPIFKAEALELISTVGTAVSIAISGTSTAEVPEFPAASL